MKNIYKMTKEELIAANRKLQSENEKLKDELDRLSDCYGELENQVAKLELDETNSIHDVNFFKFRLRTDGMMTEQLASYIEDYMRFYNRKE